MSLPVFISRIHFPVSTLGPGRRIGIWFQGCSIRCPGCVSLDTWRFGEGETDVQSILDAIASLYPIADGVTVSGGEPFDQWPALQLLLCGLRERLHSGADILVYSGYHHSVLSDRVTSIEGMIDCLVSGGFDASLPQTRPLMGSDNQAMHLLTDLGIARYSSYQRIRDDSDDRMDIVFRANGTAWMAGIPGRGDLMKLQELLKADGTMIQTTESGEPGECQVL